MKRLLALVVAVGLVVGAYFLRQQVTDDESTGGTGSGSGDTPTLICATEVRAACERVDHVDITIEAPGVTYARLIRGEPLRADGWLVSQPWPAMVAALDHPLDATTDPLARSPLVVVLPAQRPKDLACPRGLRWECVTTFAFGSPNFAFGTKDTTDGLLARHAIASGLIGQTDYASNDFEFTEDFDVTFGSIEEGAADATSGRIGGLVRTIQTAPGSYSAVVVLASDATDLNDRFEAATPAPQIHAEVVLAGDTDTFDLDAIRRELDATGWLRFDDKPSDGDNGLPNPGVMVALRDLSS